MHCLVSIIPRRIVRVPGFPRRASETREKIFGVYRYFGQCKGEIGAQYRYMTQIGWQICNIYCQLKKAIPGSG